MGYIMDAQPRRKRLPALLGRVTTRISAKTYPGLSGESLFSRKVEVHHDHEQDAPDDKKESRLERLGRGIRRWRAKRKKSHGDLQEVPNAPFPQKLNPSEESFPVLDGRPQTSQQEIVPQEASTGPTASQEFFLEETILEGKFETPEPTVLEQIIPRQGTAESTELKESVSQEPHPEKDRVPLEAIQDEAIQDEAIQDEAVQDEALQRQKYVPQQIFPAEKEDISEPIITFPPPPLPTGYSLLIWSETVPQVRVAKDRKVVFMRDRRHAYDFATSILEDRQAFWTDASHRHFHTPDGATFHHGGIAVAHRLSKGQWQIHSARVTGLSGIHDLERLAILLALQRAVQQGKEAELRRNQYGMDQRPVFKVCSDSLYALKWIDNAISLGIAIKRTVHKLEGTANDDVDHLTGLLTLSAELDRCDAFRFDEYAGPEKSFRASIGRRILEEYYKLRRLGLVEFHWVPAHTGLLGNEIADSAARIASLWYAKAAPCLGHGTGLVMPLRVLESRGRLQHGARPTDAMALQTLEGAKDLWVVLTIEGSKGENTRKTAIQPRTIVTPGGVQPMKHTLPPPTSCASGTDASGLVKYGMPNRGTIAVATSPAERKHTGRRKDQQSNKALKAMSTAEPGPPVRPAEPQPNPHEPGLMVKKKKHARVSRGGKGEGKGRRRCAHCSISTHATEECFELFPELKQASPKAYKRWAGRHRLEQVVPGAFSLMSRLHPHLKSVSCRGGMPRYMLGRAGLGYDLAALPTYRTVKFPVKREGVDFADQVASQYRRFLLAKYEWPQCDGRTVEIG